MADKIRLAVGVMGNAASLLLFAAPILTFLRVIRKKSTEEFSCVPYTIALLNCLLYAWYGLPVVSYKWENFPVATINGLGVLLEISFILIYLWFAAAKRKKQVITTKSVEFMPFYLSFFSFVASSLWMAYGLLGHDIVLASPNLVGCPLGMLQLVLYCKYRKNGVTEEPAKWDVEKNNNNNHDDHIYQKDNHDDHDKTKQLQPVAVIDHDNINGKC